MSTILTKTLALLMVIKPYAIFAFWLLIMISVAAATNAEEIVAAGWLTW